VIRRVARRTARAALTLLALAAVSWLCLEAQPGEPAEAAARASGSLPDESRGVPPALRRRIVDEAARRHGLDRPAGERFVAFVGGVVRADLGRSWRDGGSVRARVGAGLPVTLVLVGAGLLVAYLLGVAAGLAAASAPGRAADRSMRAIAAIGLALPTAWAALLALRTFTAGQPWTLFPPSAGWPPSGAWLLPLACVSYVAAAAVARHARAGLVEASALPAIVAARARGASKGRALAVHALAISRPPLAALVASLVPHLLGASLVVERAFDLPGLGALLLDSAQHGDAPMLLGAILAGGAIVAIGSIVSDALVAASDPRMREEV
jgi:ABC-type dipeptide/oligopeptide/nickel transport system permease component